VFRETQSINSRSAGAIANTLSPVSPQKSPGYTGIELGLGLKVDSFKLDSALQVYGAGDRSVPTKGRLNEAYVTNRQGPWQFSGGRRIVDWDVGFGFKPNSVVQQDVTRPLWPAGRQGRYLLQVERFGSTWSNTLVWVNPQHLNVPIDKQRGGEESALASQTYWRTDAVDLYGIARYGRRTGLSLGAAAVAVVSDSVSVHASLRGLQRYDGLASSVSPDATLVVTNPWASTTFGRAKQAVTGLTWTGASKQSVLLEYWFDGTALSDTQWRLWSARTDALRSLVQGSLAGTGLNIPATALAGNLAWQDTPLSALNQRRQNLLVRLSWQPDAVLLSLDAVYNPIDKGQVYTLSGQWLGDGVKLNTAVRWYAGPADAIVARLPQRLEGLLSASWFY
jgi:hypothetical protein